MRLFLTMFRDYPKRTLLVLLFLVLAALADGIGMTSLLPALGLLVRGEEGASAEPPSEFEQRITEVLASFGLEATFETLAVIILLAMLSKAALALISKRQVGYAVAQVATDLRIALLDALMVTRWSYYTRQPVGAVITAFSAEADRGSKAYLYAITIVSQGIQTLIFASIALAVSWQATLAAALAGVVLLSSLSSLVRMTKRAGIKQTRITRRAMSRLTDALQALKPLKAMSRERLIGPLLEEDTNRLNAALRKLVLGKETLHAVQDPLVQTLILGGGYLAVRVYGMPLAEIMVLLLLFQRTLSGLGKAQRQYQSMVSQAPAYWSIRAMIEHANSERETNLGTVAPKLQRDISLRGVDLSFGAAKILSNVSIEIPAGQITGLVGASGGGKTTIADLVVGLLRPDVGEVYIDDLPLEEIDIGQWRSSIGYVPQEMFLQNDTVARNVTLGDESISREQVKRALERAGAAGFVAAMPEGMESSVGERGSLLSGGQRQRISIARALVHDPTLLILDEASAALDPETEKALWNSLIQLKGEVTILAISHQPALFGAADRVYRVEAGSARKMPDAELPTALAAR